ncbi:MAG: PIG-L deacetylase family protein [Chloroflexota bacterium]
MEDINFSIESAQVVVPDSLPPGEALARTTHMGIGAHQDDLEIMAIDGILRCFQRSDRWFTGVVVTNGRGSARIGLYEQYTDDDMQAVRTREQIKAAIVGEYSAQVMLDFPSSRLKDPSDKGPVDDLTQLLSLAQPEVVYTHNLADKHTTHIGVVTRTIQAIRGLPPEKRPRYVYGCEVWRDLDWLTLADKVVFDVSEHEALQMALVGLFDSQISGGKRYDLATMGRRRAHATYHESHDSDAATGLVFGMDLTPLAHDETLDILEYATGYLKRFMDDVRQRIQSVT